MSHVRWARFGLFALALYAFHPCPAKAAPSAQTFSNCKRDAGQLMENPDTHVIVNDCILRHKYEYFLGYLAYSPLYGWMQGGYSYWFDAPTSGAASPEKNRGACKNDECAGDPITPGMGNKFEVKHEFTGTGPFPLDFYWTYNSNGAGAVTTSQMYVLGANRLHSYASEVTVMTWDTETEAMVTRPTGNVETFTQSGSAWVAEQENAARFDSLLDGSGATIGYQYTGENGGKELFDASGRLTSKVDPDGFVQTMAYGSNGLLQSVTDPNGRALAFTYNATGQLIQLGLPDGQSIQFGYDSTNHWEANLNTVTYPGGASIGYRYNEGAYVAASLPNALTGVIDESGTRYSTTTYDAAGRATGTYLAGGVDQYGVSYTLSADGVSASAATIVDPLGK